MNEKAPPIANKFGAFGRGKASASAAQEPPRYLDVEDFLQRVNPLSFLSLFAARKKRRSPRQGQPARSTSYLKTSLPARPVQQPGKC